MKDSAGRVSSLTWKRRDNTVIASAVTRSRSGKVIDESLAGLDARSGPNFAYDSAGRLVDAWVPGARFTYDSTSSAPAACSTGTQTNAGLNSNRVAMTRTPIVGTAITTGYCYDAADRLLATTGPDPITGVQYDAHGFTTQYTKGGVTTYFGWDGANRNLLVTATGTDPASISYSRDVTDRQHQRSYEHAGALSVVQMGARPYSPLLGRFLAVDPVEGGSANDYDYTNADPINQNDLDGRWPSWRDIGKALVVGVGVVGAVACGASVVCGVAVGVGVGAASYAVKNAGTSNFSWRGLATSAAIGGLSGGAYCGLGRAFGHVGKNAKHFGLTFNKAKSARGTDLYVKGNRVGGVHSHRFPGQKWYQIVHYHRRPGIRHHRPWQRGW